MSCQRYCLSLLGRVVQSSRLKLSDLITLFVFFVLPSPTPVPAVIAVDSPLQSLRRYILVE